MAETVAAKPTYALLGEPGMTLTEMVRKTLISLILRSEFPEGHRLYIEELSEKLGVSITPVREALLQLASEGFIENVQRRGFHVRIPTEAQIRDIWQVRQGLELMAGELVIARLKSGALSMDALSTLDDLQNVQERDSAKVDHVTKLELNASLHSALVSFSGNAVLGSMYVGLRHRVFGALIQRGSDTWRGRISDEAREHWAIINALKNLDYQAYDQAVRAHIARSLKDALIDLNFKQP
ncbi:GntR family transcriptional regulator [Brucella cytisi]|uniref:GntR family transcriptional regulator n=1 Tax=Brucella cytisi TaxID=407152 RepID=UPI0035DE075F